MGCGRSKPITLLIIGIDNAGKSTLVASLKGENVDLITPTVGFATNDIKVVGNKLNTFDLGGGENFRGIWKHYYAEVHGAIFVIDSTDSQRFEVVKATLFETLNEPRFSGKPILLLANKQDKEGAFRVEQLASIFDVKKIPGPHVLIGCSALKKGSIDTNIMNGLVWLLDKIKKDYQTISKRVKQQTLEQKEVERKKMEERRKRVEALKREREQEEMMNNNKEETQPAQESVKEKKVASQTQIPILDSDIISEDTLKRMNEEPMTFDRQASKELTLLNTPKESAIS